VEDFTLAWQEDLKLGPLPRTKNDVPNQLIEIPWSDHGYDLAWGSIGGQITRHDLSAFLARYFPPNP
jgi:hypothetical protein